MRAWAVTDPGPIAGRPLRLVERAAPEPGEGEVLVGVSASAVCRTDLHLAEGDLPPRRPGTTPGHEVVGRVDALGTGTSRFAVGDRIGLAWLRSTCGTCRWCRRGAENLCPRSTYTGWDADGGFADYAVGLEAFAYRLPERYDDVAAAPLLCAGIVGYRALRRAELPPGGRLGLYGFGASAHLVAQVALAQGARVHVRTRARAAQELALELGVDSAAGAADPVAEPLDSAVLFAPAGELVLPALAALDRGGTLSIAGIHLTDIPQLDYARHLFQERQLRSVTSSTRADGEEFLALAARLPLQVAATRWPLDQADEALRALARDEVRGVAVLTTT
jgi:alcohol dehydrogenase, propanol-preferring